MNDFHNLTAWLNRSCSELAVSVLGVFFTHNTPDEEVLTYIYSYDDSMKRLYLDSLLRGKRGISEREKFYLVNFMPFTSDDVFPCPLDEENLKMMCHLNRTVALCAYASCYLFPQSIEKKLIYACMEDRKGENASCSFKDVLKVYLQRCRDGCFASEESQRSLLALDDHELLKIMAQHCTMHNNLFKDPIMAEMIADGKHESIFKEILLYSFIASNNLQFELEQKYSSLKWNLKVSILRRALAKQETNALAFCSLTEKCSQNEKELLDKRKDFDTPQQALDFFRKEAESLLDRRAASPSFCAFIAYLVPDLAEKAYCNMRSTVKAYKDSLLQLLNYSHLHSYFPTF